MLRPPIVAFLAAVAVLAAAPAASAPPGQGVFVAGQSLGGVELGMSKRDVLDVWGKRHGVCRECPQTTWYFNYRAFAPEGTAVVFQRGRAVHVFTVWRPRGWRSATGLALGDDAGKIHELEGPLVERSCEGYSALVERVGSAESVFYVYRERLWGFGLVRRDRSPCL